jgi:hypothetical protein
MKAGTLRRHVPEYGLQKLTASSKYRGEIIHQKLEEGKVIKRYMKNDERRVIRNQNGYLEHVDDMHPIEREA